MNHLLIVSLSRSGGKLLRMLLDGHPDFNVFPFEHWNRPSKNDIPTRRIAAFRDLSVDDKLATAGASHAQRKLLRVHPEPVVAEVMQIWRVEAAGADTLPAMYECLARAYFPVIGGPPDAIVVNHCGSLCRFTRDQLDAIFGKGKHVLTIRDPRAVFSSMQGLLDRKFRIERAGDGQVSSSALQRHLDKLEMVGSVSGYLQEFCRDYRRMVVEYASCSDVVRLRFEDLVMSPESTLHEVAAQLAVEFNPVLLTPTQLGAGHAPNSSFSREGGAIHHEAAEDWHGRIAPAECRYIEDELAQEMAALGYQRLDRPGRSVLPTAPLLSGS